jgi:catechol 2,3-dioxygenase-like lactoylglutathione lyase family enzyme
VSLEQRLHHVLVLTDDLEASRRFYSEALGFEVAERPPLPFAGVWLTLGDGPCLRLADRGEYEAHAATLGLRPATGRVDHVAFRREGYEQLGARLREAGIAFTANEVPGAFRQLFVDDPNGVRIELNVPDG